MRRPVTSQRSDRQSPMARGNSSFNEAERDEDVTPATPVVEAAPRNLAAQRGYDRMADADDQIDYGDFGSNRQPTRQEAREAKVEAAGGRMKYAGGGIDDEDNPLPPQRKPQARMQPEPDAEEQQPVRLSRARQQEIDDDEADRERQQPQRKRRPEDGASMAEIQARIKAKREEKNRREGRTDGAPPERMKLKEFAQPDPVQTAQAARPPLVDPNMPSATLKQIPEHNVFPADARGDVPAGWIRQTPPSLGIPYDFDDVFVRPLEVPDLLGIHASVQNGSYTMFLDALNNAINVDIRELTASDLRFFMYWWRLNSFSRSPYTLTWTSRYGNENKTMIVKESELEITNLEMSPETYAEYRAEGIDFPRVRDAEYLGDVTLSPTDRWMAERAQYIVTDETGEAWYPSRFERLKAGGVKMFELVRDFSKLIKHGIDERVKVVDAKYEPVAAMNALRAQAQYLARIVNTAGGNVTEEMILQTNERVDDFLSEADEIERTLTHIDMIENAVDETALPEGLTSEDLPDLQASLKPREEAITLRISALDFFPEI